MQLLVPLKDGVIQAPVMHFVTCLQQLPPLCGTRLGIWMMKHNITSRSYEVHPEPFTCHALGKSGALCLCMAELLPAAVQQHIC